MSHININCEVHIPEDVAEKLAEAIRIVNNQIPDEYEIVAIKTKGGVIAKKEDLENE